MNYFKLRVDINKDVSITDVEKVVSSYSQCYCYSIEGVDTTNMHTHFYLEMSKGAPALRMRLRSLGLKGNGGYSLKELDEEKPIEYLAYIMKEGRFHNVGLPENVILSAQEYNCKVQNDIKEKKEAKKGLLVTIEKELKEKIV